MRPDRISQTALVVIAAALAWMAVRPTSRRPRRRRPARRSAWTSSGSAGAPSSTASSRCAAWNEGRDPQRP